MTDNLKIEFDPTTSEGIRQSADFLGYSVEDFIFVAIGSMLNKRMETDPRYPLSEQINPGDMSLTDSIEYILKLFVAFNKAKQGVRGFEFGTIDRRMKLCR